MWKVPPLSCLPHSSGGCIVYVGSTCVALDIIVPPSFRIIHNLPTVSYDPYTSRRPSLVRMFPSILLFVPWRAYHGLGIIKICLQSHPAKHCYRHHLCILELIVVPPHYPAIFGVENHVPLPFPPIPSSVWPPKVHITHIGQPTQLHSL